MTNADWWATVKTPGQAKARPPRPSGRVWTMHHGTHEAALDLRLVPGLGAEIVLSIDNELRRARFYWRTQAFEMPLLVERDYGPWLPATLHTSLCAEFALRIDQEHLIPCIA